MSVQRLEEMIGSSKIKGVIDEHEKLIFHNNTLANQVEQLREANEVLQKERSTLQHSLLQKSESFKEDMRIIERTRHDAASGNETDKRRVAEMVDDIQHNVATQAKRKHPEKSS
jgi:hypothetical protein